VSSSVAPLAGSAPLLVALALTRCEPRETARESSCYARTLLLRNAPGLAMHEGIHGALATVHTPNAVGPPPPGGGRSGPR
jgi:hypothetical protein